MNTLRDYVNFRLTHADKVAIAEGYPLILENCKKYKPMRDLRVYGNSVQDGTPTPETPIDVQSVGELVTDETDVNYGKYKIPVKTKEVLYDAEKHPLTISRWVSGKDGAAYNGSEFVACLDYIPCVDLRGKTLTLNYTYSSNPGIAFYDDTKTFISGIPANHATFITAIVPDNAYYYRFSIKKDYANEKDIVVGNTATTNIFLSEPLRKLGDYADYIDFKNKKAVHYTDVSIIEETVTPELPKLTAKTNIIKVDTSLTPSNTYGKYIKR